MIFAQKDKYSGYKNYHFRLLTKNRSNEYYSDFNVDRDDGCSIESYVILFKQYTIEN